MADWPPDDQRLWENHLARNDDPFEGTESVLSPVTIAGRRYTWGIFLAFAKRSDPNLLKLPLHLRLTRGVIENFIADCRRRCRDTTVVVHLERLYFVARSLCPEQDFHWIYQIARRIAVRAPRIVHPLVVSTQLYSVGLEGLRQAQASEVNERYLGRARAFRDALLATILVIAPMRLGNLAALRLCDLTKVGNVWQITARAEHAKTRKPAEYEVAFDIAQALDVYLADIRPQFPGADIHDGLWPSSSGCPLRAKSISRLVKDYTSSQLGTSVSPHGFRRAAAALIAQVDPENIHSAKDLLGHQDFRITERHYLPAAQTRRAGRELTRVLRFEEWVRR